MSTQSYEERKNSTLRNIVLLQVSWTLGFGHSSRKEEAVAQDRDGWRQVVYHDTLAVIRQKSSHVGRVCEGTPEMRSIYPEFLLNLT